MFAATAATIVSDTVVDRTDFNAHLICSVFISAIIYPVFGHWAWTSLHGSDSWLENLGFLDFAGSTLVHSVGAWAGLAGAIIFGPRDWYVREGPAREDGRKGDSRP